MYYCSFSDNNMIVSRFNEVYYINESQKFQLECIVDGNPLSNIDWVFATNGSVLKKDRNTNMSLLQIYFANCLDFGQYKVLAENRKGSTTSLTTTLAVNCKSSCFSSPELKVQMSFSDKDLSVVCCRCRVVV